ncbi:MAG: hypothetical protein ACQES5_00135 [Thermodesulfobacteriota bacterium]
MQFERRKAIIFSIAVFLLLIGIYQWAVIPIVEYNQNILSEQKKTKIRLKELLALNEKYEAAKRPSGEDASLIPGFSGATLFSYLEAQASKDGLKPNIDYMRPSTQDVSDELEEKTVQMRLKKISLKKFVLFLEHVELGSETVYVKRISVRSPLNNSEGLNVDLTFCAFKTRD